MKVGVLKQLLLGFDDDVNIRFEFSPSDSFKYELDLQKSLDFETSPIPEDSNNCERISGITFKLKQ